MSWHRCNLYALGPTCSWFSSTAAYLSSPIPFRLPIPVGKRIPRSDGHSSNLLSLLEDKGGLKQAYAYTKQLGYPSYGKFNNGAENFDQSLSLFNANLVYADLYLLRGANKGDYEQAASYYYKYLKEDTKASVSGVAAVNHFVSKCW